MRAGSYLRISSDRTGEGLGVDRQREDAAELITRRGWTTSREFVDNNRSAARGKMRPAFRDLLAAIGGGELDAVVAWNLDRLARTARDRLALIEACQEHRVIIALVRGSDIDCSTAAGRMTAGILGEVAQHEIDTKSERQIRAVAQAAAQGRRVGGRRPFGYEADGVTVRPAEAEAIRVAYRDVLAGVSLSAIARSWTARGLITEKRRYADGHEGELTRWTRDTVRRVLLNPRNAGIRTLRGVETAPAEWPALVSVETLRAAQSVLQAPERSTRGTGHLGRQLLTGLALCARCGRTVHGGGASHGRPIYRCTVGAHRAGDSGADPGGSGLGPHVNRLAEPVDDYVAEIVIERLSRADAADLLVDPGRPDVDQLRADALTFRGRLDALAAEFADGELTASQLRTATERLRAKLAAVDDQLADAGRVDVLGPLVRASDVRAAWNALGRVEHGGRDRQRAVISALTAVILHAPGRGTRTFRPESVEFRPHTGML